MQPTLRVGKILFRLCIEMTLLHLLDHHVDRCRRFGWQQERGRAALLLLLFAGQLGGCLDYGGNRGCILPAATVVVVVVVVVVAAAAAAGVAAAAGFGVAAAAGFAAAAAGVAGGVHRGSSDGSCKERVDLRLPSTTIVALTEDRHSQYGCKD